MEKDACRTTRQRQTGGREKKEAKHSGKKRSREMFEGDERLCFQSALTSDIIVVITLLLLFGSFCKLVKPLWPVDGSQSLNSHLKNIYFTAKCTEGQHVHPSEKLPHCPNLHKENFDASVSVLNPPIKLGHRLRRKRREGSTAPKGFLQPSLSLDRVQ